MNADFKLVRLLAVEKVKPHIIQDRQFQAVPHAAARTLLGDEKFAQLLADPIRRCGPSPGTIYPWNVADYVAVDM